MKKMTNAEKINYYIDLLIKEVAILEKYKCNETSFKSDFKDVMIKCNAMEKINDIIHNAAYNEWINK